MGVTGGCYRHPDRVTGIHCTRCGRFICPDCMIQASVGHHCPTCVKEAQGDLAGVQQVRPAAPSVRGSLGVVVPALLALNTLIFILQQALPGLTGRLADNPTLVESGEYYRLLTATFLHANVLHLLLNMAGLFFIGPDLEAALGRVRLLAVYLVAGLGGSVCFNLFGAPDGFSLGASGAVIGLLAGYFLLARASGFDAGQVGLLLAVNLVSGLAFPQIDLYGHLGGAVAGAALTATFLLTRHLPGRGRVAAQGASVLVLLAGMAVLLGVDNDDPSSDVEYVAVLQSQIDALRRLGGTYESVLRDPPLMLPSFQTTENGAVSYSIVVAKDPDRERRVRVDWGDGRSQVVTFPRGRGAAERKVSHRFPPHVARYKARATLVDPADGASEEGVDFQATTEVCPGGTTVPVPTTRAEDVDAEVPICGRAPPE